jgi:O-antigen ligase
MSKRFPFIQLGCIAVAWGLWYLDPSVGLALVVALLPLIPSLLIGQNPLGRTPLDVPLLVFLLTAGIGVWATYDRSATRVVFPQATPVGWQALWGLVLALLVFYAFAAMETSVQQRWAMALLAGFGAVTAFWFAAANDWTAQPAKLMVISRLGVGIQAVLPRLPNPGLNPNAAARMITIFLPAGSSLAVKALGSDWKGRSYWAVWGIATGTLATLGLVLTASRGAWLGVGCGLAWGVLWWLAGRLYRGRSRLRVFACLAGLGVLTGGVFVALSPALRAALQSSQPVANRLGIFDEALLLLRDYPFTGIGLGEFALVHSTYALMIHVPILVHAHSMFLDIALGQGILGALAAIGVLGGAAWLGLSSLERKGAGPILVAGLLALIITTVHDLVDDPLYYSPGAPMIWVPAGLIVAGWRTSSAMSSSTEKLRTRKRLILGVVAVIVLASLPFLWRPLTAAWYANLGAVRQTRIELSRYDFEHFDNPTLDQIRQEADLSVAERYFVQALALNPGQVTARTRLAEIAQSRGEYDQALVHAQAAWDAGHRDRVTRLVLGDALVAMGDVDRGVQVVRGLKWAEGRLDGQAWYRYWLGEDYGRAADAWRAVVELNPRNDRARHSITAAESRAEER